MLDAEQERALAVFHAASEFLFRGEKQMLVEGIGGDLDLNLPPPVMIESAASRALVTHMLCWSRAICFSAAACSENDHGT